MIVPAEFEAVVVKALEVASSTATMGEAAKDALDAIRPRVTDTNEDGSPAITFAPWTDGHAVGFEVTRHADDAVSYVYLNPSQDTFSDGKLHPDVFVYTGPIGHPSEDVSHHFYNIDFEGEA